ncbi:hypothetical protein [Poritiphilus flavus]|uniref:Uncharacterized protein n=1 Tax=Poritiphilus flavus TaxID=2697053 RepID=A0A6L9EB38_9FLAO|nr:hypothetical protein [Poritiphilus flavus]NAS11956.1 hypothetical protein [Poritiphilus flavus]
MKKKIFFLTLLLLTGFISCKDTKKGTDHIEIVKNYYQALDESNFNKLSPLIADSFSSRELEYVKVFSKREYREFIRWDSVFHPEYQILEIAENDGLIKLKVSKAGIRSLFLNEEPIITREEVRIQEGKIESVAITEYVVFNEARWTKNRVDLLSFIEENHPELNGFLTDQTMQGAMNYLKAIALFKSSNGDD